MFVIVTVTGTDAAVAPVALKEMLAVPEPTAVTTNVPAELPAATVATAVLELLAVIPLAPVAVTDCVVPLAFNETALGEALIAGNCGVCVGVVTGGEDPPPPHPVSAAKAMRKTTRFIIGRNSYNTCAKLLSYVSELNTVGPLRGMVIYAHFCADLSESASRRD